MSKDDRMMPIESVFENEEVVITEKLDGKNNSMYTDYMRARFIMMDSHPSRHWIKNFWAQISYNIPIELK